MANNVLDQTNEKEVHTSSNQVACTVIEVILPFASDEHFERYQNAFASNYRPICSDKFSSHILEKLVAISMLRGIATDNKPSPSAETPQAKRRKTDEIPSEREYNLTSDFSDEHRQKCREFVIRTSKFLLNNLEDFVWDTYASHVMRTCLDSLSGIFQVKKSFVTNTPADSKSSTEPALTVPEDWLVVVQEYAKRLHAWPQFADFPYSELSSGLLQSILNALHKRDKKMIKELGKKLLSESFKPTVGEWANKNSNPSAVFDGSGEIKVNEVVDESEETKPNIEVKDEDDNNKEKEATDKIDKNLPSVFSNDSAVHCLETVIKVCGSKLFTQIYLFLFSGRLVTLSKSRLANFSVQKLLDRAEDKEEFESIFDELENSIEELLQIGHTGVVSALSNACLRLCTRQGPFMKSIQTALDCNQPKEKSDKFALCVLKLKPYNVFVEDKSNFVHIHGAVILQNMLHFNKPIKLVQCILDTSNENLAEIFCSPKGSHVVDAFIESKSVGGKSREKLVRHLDGCYLTLAMSKNGSWAMEKLFEAALGQQKVRIVKELSEKQNQLNSTPFGRVINQKLHIDKYRLSPDQWQAAFNKESKVEKLFKDLL